MCGNATAELFTARDYRRPNDATEYAVGWCDRCALGRLAGRFSAADVAAFFDIPCYTRGGNPREKFKKTFTDRVVAHLAWRFDRGIQFTPADLGPAYNRTVCDIGCGDGKYLRQLRAAGFAVTGIEPDAAARATAAETAEVYDGTPKTCRPRSPTGLLMLSRSRTSWTCAETYPKRWPIPARSCSRAARSWWRWPTLPQKAFRFTAPHGRGRTFRGT